MNKPPHVLEIFLQPGELYFGDRDTRIRTLLGSCVAITLWHPHLLIGGMCHFMLPGARQSLRDGPPDGRYADNALTMFMRELHQTGTRPAEYDVKIFGGGDQFPDQQRTAGINVPDKNIAAGLQLLDAYGFSVKARHLGGTGHRNVIFDLWNGHVWVKHVEKIAGSSV